MLGDLTHSSYSTLEMVMQQFVTVTLQPIIVLIEEEFNRKLISKYESVRIGLDETLLIKYDTNTESNYFKGLVQSGIITINEARRKMGYSEIEGADKLILPYTDVAQNTINTDTNISEAKNE
jgi:HK97 family phage portal protein